jgi:hypothetical protein
MDDVALFVGAPITSRPRDPVVNLEIAKAVAAGTASTEVERRLAGLVGAKTIKKAVRKQVGELLTIVEAQGKKERRGRKAKSGKRTATGQLSRAAEARDLGTPEVQEKRKQASTSVVENMFAVGALGKRHMNALEFYSRARGKALSEAGMPRGIYSSLGGIVAGEPMPEDAHVKWAERYREMNDALTQAERFAVFDAAVANRPPSNIWVLIEALDRLVELTTTPEGKRKDEMNTAIQTKTVQVEVKNNLTRKIDQLESKIDRRGEDVRKAFIATAILATQQRSMN